MVLQTDASIKGLGACLMQLGKPVYFASKALTETQKGDVAIKLESLVVMWPWKNSIISYVAPTSSWRWTKNP